jgi:putative transposase
MYKKLSDEPNHKSRKNPKRHKFPVRADHLYFTNNTVNIEKIGKIKYKTDFEIPEGRDVKFSNPRIRLDQGKWILTFGIEYENQAEILNEKSMGIDLGVKDLATVSYGGEKMVFGNINKSRKIRQLEAKMKHLQRNKDRKKKGSKNRKKAKAKWAKLKRHLANIKQDYLHKTTHTLVQSLPNRVVMEDLNVKGMMKNHNLAKAIQDASLGTFTRLMKYKSEWRGIEFVQVGRFYPSSKKCSCCGEIKRDLKLRDRVYRCSSCGLEIDRDFNAALNLERYVEPVRGLTA